MDWLERERATCRRPITSDEVEGLEALGEELEWLRWDQCHVSRSELGVLAQVSESHLTKIERGTRRTQPSTLLRIATALVALRRDLGPVDELHADLIDLGGESLARESVYAGRVDRRRGRRWKRRRREGRDRRRVVRLYRLLDHAGRTASG